MSVGDRPVPLEAGAAWIEVDLDALAANLALVRGRLGANRRVIAVVKADAYGHGAAAVARRLEAEGVEMLAVALPAEGLALRGAGVTAPILVMGPSEPSRLPEMAGARLTPTAWSLPSLAAMIEQTTQTRAPIPFHLKVDTGMGRLGVLPEEVPEAIARVTAAGAAVALEGIYTHLACSDDPDDPHTAAQLSRFATALATARAASLSPRWIHAAPSGGILDHPASWYDAVRPGLILYGHHPSESCGRLQIEPILSFRARLERVKRLPGGSPVGYGHAWITPRPSLIGTVGAGYADGLPRLLSHRGAVLVRGRRVPFAGRISMDHATVDLTEVPGAVAGDEVILIGRQGEAEVTVEEIAAWAETIPYEILSRLGPRVPRIHRPL